MISGKKRIVGAKPAAFLATSAILVALTAVGAQSISTSETASACVCSTESTANYNSSLPASHPGNRCARQSKELNWANWFSGSSRSNQLHFVDLLELLYGHTDSPLDDVNLKNSNKNTL
ncbi:hypothetical protein GCM10007978_29990 [Shewanella hanedai]|uniref:Uncharacterized protein n=1 Tax=Shewanella hanedai TaxID=25 RepID=A0A553JQW9_SHEHA|nr:hypothetical protein [Shewanella hanedai]TRY14843.1 hypothetical protein FN961_07565 [Shewanella hanedai]GGI90381.1 hypothetical protein GCM10007978_29990 [Shewanella hanedai]